MKPARRPARYDEILAVPDTKVAEIIDGELIVSPLPLGSGMTRSAHGPLPVPGPATIELLRGFAVRLGDGAAELVTPTGAATVAVLTSVPVAAALSVPLAV